MSVRRFARRVTAQHQPMLVEWVDSRQPVPAWSFLQSIKPQGAVRCLSIGWLVAKNAETLLLAANLGDVGGDDLQACGVIEIPRRAVLHMQRLRLPAWREASA